MLTHGLFRTSTDLRSPVFEGYHNPRQRWDRWATPSFNVDQVHQIISWVMSAPDPGESLTWDGNTLVHRLGEAEPGRTLRITPNAHGRYRLGNRVWPWIEVPAPTGTTEPRQATAQAPQPTPGAPAGRRKRAATAQPAVPATAPALQAVSSPDPAGSSDRVHRVGARTVIVRRSTRQGSPGGFDVFSSCGQRLTHADPFPTAPTPDQLGSFLTTRKRGLDLLLAEHGPHADLPREQDLYALVHGTQPVPRYAALTRTERGAFIDLSDSLDTAVQHLRDRLAQDRTCTSLGVQDLDGGFLPATAEVTITLAATRPAAGAGTIAPTTPRSRRGPAVPRPHRPTLVTTLRARADAAIDQIVALVALGLTMATLRVSNWRGQRAWWGLARGATADRRAIPAATGAVSAPEGRTDGTDHTRHLIPPPSDPRAEESAAQQQRYLWAPVT